MSHRCTPNTWGHVRRAFLLCQTQASSLPSSGASHCRVHAQQRVCYKADCLCWKRVRQPGSGGRKRWLHKAVQVRQSLGLHTSTLYRNTSASRWSAGLSQQMSRIRSTLDTVSKAVSGTHTELLSKLTRLKPKSLGTAPRKAEVSAESTPKAEETTSAPAPTNAAASPSTPSPPQPVISLSHSLTPSAAVFDAGATTPTPCLTSTQTTAAAALPTASDGKERKRKRVLPPVKAHSSTKEAERQASSSLPDNKNTSSKQTVALFHPSTFSVSLDETYNYLAHHINSYFGSTTKTQEKKVDNADYFPASSQAKKDSAAAPVSPPASKKGLGHYLSYSAPTVQSFVVSYIHPLVPRFRTADPKAAKVEEKKLEVAAVKQVEATEQNTKEDEKAKKLLLQREKIIARVSVDNRTRALVQALHRASDVRVYINRVEDLSYHLLEFPETRGVAVKEKVIPCLLRLEQATDPSLRAAVREALALVGYHKPVKGRGIRILSIDGGGLRGLLALQTLQKLEALTGRPIYKLFDYVCGVSTGAVLGFMLGAFQIPMSECDDIYRKLGSAVFKQNVIVGTMKMGWNHAFYDSEAWESILKEKMGSNLLVETSRDPECPKVAAVSTIVNRGTSLKAYVFRNYNLLPGVRSHYLGGCQHHLWQAIRATSAAPGYFQEFTLGNDLHQDGGLLINNPTALAIHESNCLWPDTPLECVVSLGTGRYENPGKNSATYTSLKTKITNVISSATDTEEVHAMLDAFLPPDTYFRFNPYMSDDVTLDEVRLEKLDLLQAEGVRYLDRNEEKLKQVCGILTREKGSFQRMAEWARLRADMYNGLPFKL